MCLVTEAGGVESTLDAQRAIGHVGVRCPQGSVYPTLRDRLLLNTLYSLKVSYFNYL